MKKFEFSLARIKHYRGQVEETEKNTLATMRAELRVMNAELEEINALIRRKSDELVELMKKGAFPAEILTANRYLTVKKQELEQKRNEILQKEQDIEKQLQVVIEATREVAKLDKLEEHQLEDYREAEKKEQEAFIEEFLTNSQPRNE